MARIAMTFADRPDGQVDIQVYFDEQVEGAPETPAQRLAKSMLTAAKHEASVTDVQPRVLTEADSLADRNGTPRPDNPSPEATALQQAEFAAPVLTGSS